MLVNGDRPTTGRVSSESLGDSIDRSPHETLWRCARRRIRVNRDLCGERRYVRNVRSRISGVGRGVAPADIGYLPFGRDDANLFFHVIAKRYERAATIVTSDLPFTQWASTLADDATLTAALLDRLLHHAYIVQVRGESYRMKDKRRAGHVRTAS
jgi:hypothetical protein